MNISDVAQFRTFIVERQTLIAKALHSLFNQYALIDVVGDGSSVNADDLRRTRPDLIIFGLDNASHEFAEAFALARSVLPKVRFCVLSSYTNPDIMQHSIASGADGFLVKDVSPGELDVAFRILASGATYVDPRAAGGMLKRKSVGGNSGSPINDLTPRESDILRLIAGGFSNKEISVKLRLSQKTIKNYVSRIFSKLNVSARTQAAVYAIKAGFV